MSREENPKLTPETEPGEAVAEQGLVMLEGPDAVAVTMTADAAEGTAHSLLAAAQAARAQSSETGGVSGETPRSSNDSTETK